MDSAKGYSAYCHLVSAQVSTSTARGELAAGGVGGALSGRVELAHHCGSSGSESRDVPAGSASGGRAAPASGEARAVRLSWICPSCKVGIFGSIELPKQMKPYLLVLRGVCRCEGPLALIVECDRIKENVDGNQDPANGAVDKRP